jgi:hypothetical protein
MLVANCLFACQFNSDTGVEESRSSIPVGEAVVRSWPNRIVKPIFEWIKDVSELSERDTDDEEELEGNSSESTD